MSWQATNWASKQKCGGHGGKCLLYALANYADMAGRAWPSQKRLCDDTEMSERSMRSWLKALEDRGLLAIQERRRPNGTRRPDIIVLNMGDDAGPQDGYDEESPPPPSDPPPETTQPATVAACSPTGNERPINRQIASDQPANSASHIENNQEEEPSKELSKEPERETRARGDDKKPSVKRFLLKWPTAAIDDKAHITRAWEALPADECEPCLDGVDRFLAELKKHGRKHIPAGWKYVEDRSWTLIGQTSAGEPANPTFDCWSREWWAVLISRIERNAPVKFFVRYASEPGKRTTGEVAANMPTTERIAQFGNYPSDGPEMKAWRPWFEARGGIKLPKWETRVWVFLPSPGPPNSTAPPPPELSQEDIRAFD